MCLHHFGIFVACKGGDMRDAVQGPHVRSTVRMAGDEPSSAQAAIIMLHGRGATADSILNLATELEQSGFAFLAPQAAGNSWYPFSFLAPIEKNEPDMSSALAAVAGVLTRLEEAGIPPKQVILLGFSQGACLATEFAARHARRYGGVVGLSGGLIGPPGTPRQYGGSLAGTPVFLGCGDVDPHIPQERVDETAAVLDRLGADVTKRIYHGIAHTVIEDEIEHVREMMSALLRS
jgi:phospholipase/carboxylesterase